MDKDANVRAIGRGLTVLKLINRHRTLTVADIARLSAMPYQTTCRIVETLVDEGMIERDRHRKVYRPTPLVQLLSVGYGHTESLVHASQAAISDLTRKILWPAMVCSRVGCEMIVQASTHRISPKAFGPGEPGRTIPILESSSGLVYLAFCGDAEREAILTFAGSQSTHAGAAARLHERFSSIRATGFDCYDGCDHGDTRSPLSALSAPVMGSNGCEGTVSVSYLSRAHTPDDAASLFSADLLATAGLIETQLATARR